MGAYGRTPWFKRVSKADRERAEAALERVGLADRAGDRFGTLSGGQRQRVLIARALVQDARVLLLDEPLSGVDRPSAAQIERVFGELQAEGRALLVATHDVAQARAWPACCASTTARSRSARPTGADHRRAARDLRRRARDPRRRPARPSPSPTTTTTTATDALQRDHAAGVRGGDRARARVRAARRVDPAAASAPTRRSRSATRCCRGS